MSCISSISLEGRTKRCPLLPLRRRAGGPTCWRIRKLSPYREGPPAPRSGPQASCPRPRPPPSGGRALLLPPRSRGTPALSSVRARFHGRLRRGAPGIGEPEDAHIPFRGRAFPVAPAVSGGAAPGRAAMDQGPRSCQGRSTGYGTALAREVSDVKQSAARGEVRKALPAVSKKTLVFVLEGDFVETWEQTREAVERLAGKCLSDIEVFDLMCAEALSSYAFTPAHGLKHRDFKDNGGDSERIRRLVLERDGWKCTRPGCRCRSGLEVNHIIPRSRGGPDADWNCHTVCAVCHAAITRGLLKVRGRAPDGLTWEGPFGVIEKPLPLADPIHARS